MGSRREHYEQMESSSSDGTHQEFRYERILKEVTPWPSRRISESIRRQKPSAMGIEEVDQKEEKILASRRVVTRGDWTHQDLHPLSKGKGKRKEGVEAC